jgi:hypothetical protein
MKPLEIGTANSASIAFTLVEQQKSSNSKVGNFGYGKLAPAGFICVQGSRERRQLQRFAAAMRSITGGLHDSSTAPRTRPWASRREVQRILETEQTRYGFDPVPADCA